MIAVSSGGAVSAVLTHGFVYSGMRLAGAQSPWSYEGLFQHAILSMWSIWNYLHGWPPPRSHVEEFGRFCMAPFVFFICPMFAFGVFALASRQKITRGWWKPLAIVIAGAVLAVSFPNPLRSVGLSVPLAEAGRAIIVFLLMVGSTGSLPQLRLPRSKPVRQIATA